jgi:DNA-binding Xre family transcriptional regulator
MDETWDRVAKAVNDRMLDIHLGITELSTKAGISVITIRRVRQGKGASLHAQSLRKLSDALGWTPDSIQRIVNGQGPVVSDQPADQTMALSGVIDATGLTPEQITKLQNIALGMRLANGA